MPLDFFRDCAFTGPALPEPFVRFELESELAKAGLLPKMSAAETEQFQDSWRTYRRKLRELVRGGRIRVRKQVVEPLIERLGFARLEDGTEVQTREGQEDGGDLLVSSDRDLHLRVWCTDFDEDLDAPSRRGAAYRYSRVRIAQRVLLACGERLGLLTNGTELRFLISDPACPDSQIVIDIDPAWKDKRSYEAPDSYRLLIALASPKGSEAIPELVEKARLQQTRVTKELRRQAREAVEAFLQEVLNHPANQEKLGDVSQRIQLARQLWREALIVVYRLLFILKLESTDDPARSFSFSSTSLWRNTFSPSVALPPFVRKLLDRSTPTGHFLEDAVRGLFRMFVEGLDCTELHVRPLGGTLFGEKVTPLLSSLAWGEHAVAFLLDRLLWTAPKRGAGRERVHYGSLDVEDLGRVYEALLELEPGIATEPMSRLRRAKLEVVVPLAQGERYRPTEAVAIEESDVEEDIEEESEDEDSEEPAPRRKTKVEWIEEIQSGRFYLRVGLGRKATGSYYTPHSFVRFLVQETLGPLVSERSPKDDPRPAEILKLKALDPAMGSGHFLVEACRFLGARLYEAVRLCDERLAQFEKATTAAQNEEIKRDAEAQVADYRQRLNAFLPPDAELLAYLPSRSPEAAESGLSQKRAEAICRRLVAIHCLYGVDKNPLAVELAKVSLWIESHSEGLPLTFLDHRLVLGDSITGPFFHHLLTYPGSKRPIEDLYTQELPEKLTAALTEAIALVGEIESTLGATIGDVEVKQTMRQKLESALAPFKIAAAAWAGGVILGQGDCDDDSYRWLLDFLSRTGELPPDFSGHETLIRMIERGLGCKELASNPAGMFAALNTQESISAFPYDLAFPEVFFRSASVDKVTAFDAVLGNPPWDKVLPADKEFFASYNFSVLDAPTKRERTRMQTNLLADPVIYAAYETYIAEFRSLERSRDAMYSFQTVAIAGERTIGKQDSFRLFLERNAQLLARTGYTGVVVPSGFHANEGATGVRRLYLQQLALLNCFSFENSRKLFEIHRSFKFAVLVARGGGPTTAFSCAYYLRDDEWLFRRQPSDDRELLYSLQFVQETGAEYLSFIELRSRRDLGVTQKLFDQPLRFAGFCSATNMDLGRDLNVTDDAWRFTPATTRLVAADSRNPEVANEVLHSGYLVLHEGKTFHQYTDHWEDAPRYLVAIANLTDRLDLLHLATYFRLSYRQIAASTNERTGIFALLPPGIVFTNKAPSDQSPERRSNSDALRLLSICNAFPFDFALRLFVSSSTVNYFFLQRTPMPDCDHLRSFLTHNALRLSANHAGFQSLWGEQMGDHWREPQPRFTWPVLPNEKDRWTVRAAIDAVVAEGYGLSREDYQHVLASFSHKSYPQGLNFCVQMFEELKLTGHQEFTRKYDPYWDIPLNENLPEPVINISLPEIEHDAQSVLPLSQGVPETTARAARRRSTRGNGGDEEGYERVRRLLSERLRIGSSDLQSTFGFDAAQSRALLKKLVQEGVAVVEGSGRATRYVVRPEAANGHTAQ